MPSMKISALTPATAIGGGELLPAVQGNGNVAVTPAQLRTHALAGLTPRLLRPHAKLMVDGDSKRHEPAVAARWVNARISLECWIGSHDFGAGGSTSGTQATTGLTNASRMGAMQTAVATETAAGWTVDMLLTIGTNDVSAGSSSEAVLANLRRYHDAFRAAGGRCLILMAIDPRNGIDAAATRRLIAINRGYADYCTAVPDAIFCDTTAWWLDPVAAGSTAFTPIGAAGGTAFAMTQDGLHGSAYGSYRKQFALAPIMQALYRPRPSIGVVPGDVYNVSDAIRGNILGTGGRTVALGGTSNLANNGTGTSSGTPPSGWTADGTLSGSLSVAFSVENCAALEQLSGSDGWQTVRLAFSGTPDASGGMTVRRYVPLPQLNATPMFASMLLNVEALTGCFGLSLSTVNVGPTMTVHLGASGTPNAADQLPRLDGLHGVEQPVVPASNLNSGLSIGIRWLAGVPLSGSIDLVGACWRRADPLPAAAV